MNTILKQSRSREARHRNREKRQSYCNTCSICQGDIDLPGANMDDTAHKPESVLTTICGHAFHRSCWVAYDRSAIQQAGEVAFRSSNETDMCEVAVNLQLFVQMSLGSKCPVCRKENAMLQHFVRSTLMNPKRLQHVNNMIEPCGLVMDVNMFV